MHIIGTQSEKTVLKYAREMADETEALVSEDRLCKITRNSKIVALLVFVGFVRQLGFEASSAVCASAATSTSGWPHVRSDIFGHNELRWRSHPCIDSSSAHKVPKCEECSP